MKLALVGDIGGTNARFALWENDQLHSVRVLATVDFVCPEDAIRLYLLARFAGSIFFAGVLAYYLAEVLEDTGVTNLVRPLSTEDFTDMD